MGRRRMMERRTNSGFSLPLTLMFLVILVILLILFGWIVLPIAVGIFLLISASVAVHDRIKLLKSRKYRPLEEEPAGDPKLGKLNLILYRAIFNRSEEQAKSVAEDMMKRESSDSIDSVIAEIQKELNTPSLRLADLHPYTDNPTEEEIRAFLTMVLQKIKDKHNPCQSG